MKINPPVSDETEWEDLDFSPERTKNMTNVHEISRAYWLGVRDARMGHAISHPVRPFSREEYQSYQRGYNYRADCAALAKAIAGDR